MHVIEQIGAVAGLAAFFGLAVLAFLQFMQARHVRDLEDKATFVPEGLDLPAPAPAPAKPAKAGKGGKVATPASAGEAAGDDTAEQTEQPEPVAAGGKPTLEAARQVEIARAAADRRARFEQRRRPGAGPAGPATGSAAGGGRGRPEPRAMVAIGLGVAVLAAGIVFGAGRILGGGSDNGSPSGGGAAADSESTGPPTEVAVLNGTPIPGLAATLGQQVRDAGFKLGAVTNTETPFTATTVMFDQNGQADAQTVAAKLQVQKVEPISSDIKKISNGAPVVVIVGEDRAGT